MTVATSQPAVPTQQLPTVAAPVVTSAEYPGLHGVEQWLGAAAAAEQLARQLVRSFFVPAAYKPGNPNDPAGVEVAVANATGAILLGQSLGLDPLTALQQIYVVHGRPGMYAKMKVALAMARGHRVWDVEYGPERVTVAGHRAGEADKPVEITITIEDAKRAGWTSNAAYAKTPADMLWARAAGRVVDRIAADVLFGLGSIEDLEDAPPPVAPVRRVEIDVKGAPSSDAEIAQTIRSTAAATLRGRPVTEAIAPAPVEQPAPAEPEPTPEPVAAEPEAADASRLWDAINARFRSMPVKGLNGPGQSANRLAVVSHITARTIARGGDLTADEAQLVLDNLAGDAGVDLAHSVLNPAPEQAAEPEQGDVEIPDPSDGDDPWAPAS